MTITTLDTIPRDGFGRPKVIPPKGGKPVAYTRCTTYVSCLEDTYNLGRWMQRMVAKGLSTRPDLLLAVSATDVADKGKLDKIVDDAREAAAANAAATIGTAVHALTERMDRGEDVGVVPDAYRPDLDAYAAATKPLKALMIEQFCVLDELKVGGTPDRVVELDGRNYIADVKTGSIEYGLGKISMQLAVYARSAAYDHTTGKRTPLPNVDRDRAIVIHLPAGKGQCELVWVDIAAGWEAVQLCGKVRAWRSRRDLAEPLDLADTTPVKDRAAELADRIAQCASVRDLEALWAAHQGLWGKQHTDLAAARKALLQGDRVA